MDLESQFLGHKNNISQKVRIAKGEHAAIAADVFEKYKDFESNLQFPDGISDIPFGAVKCLNSYVDFAKDVESKHSIFNWRSNFAGSIIPEFFYRYLVWRLSQLKLSAVFSTKDSIVDATFSTTESGGIHIRQKDQDLCVGVRREKLICGGKTYEFVAPAVSCEVKTNIDINKLNGLDFSAERLKRSFPSARYFLITETIDFSLKDNYAAGFVDEVFVLRKQVRSVARRTKAPIEADVVKAAADVMIEILARAWISARHVYDRLPTGRLIRFEEIKAIVK